MTQSLRGRLLIGVISLVVLGLLIADTATYAALQSSLISQLDDQIKSGHNAAISGLGGPNEGPGPSGSGLPAGTVIELLSPSGAVLLAKRLEVPGSTASSAMPDLPEHLPAASEKAPAFLTLAGTGGVRQYRAAIWPEDFFSGNYVVLAIPMTGVLSTLSRLLELEAVISAGVVVATAILALLIIRISLRPLEKMGTVANEIAAGDLSRRVEPATGKTEIGRLGLALNGMLSQIESAFAERTASNGRLRRFVADASHELRTPLTSIRGYSEMLRRGAAESPTDAELARRRIEEEAIRMTGLVDDMLVLARVDQGRPLDHEPVDLQAIAGDAAADARAVAPQRDINLTVPGRVVVNGDDTRLRQVVGNLVRNALVHTPPKTPIDISLSTEDSVARLSVADHGPGLAADDIDRIFEPFYRADPSRSRDSGGAGLGLSIVSAVVTAHGGHVKVRETEGGGATFEVELPIAGT
ncbi:MAG TPA: HAMP domain-containing sensor histidine kinase [Candidatus Dormibacteraeota bacterium]